MSIADMIKNGKRPIPATKPQSTQSEKSTPKVQPENPRSANSQSNNSQSKKPKASTSAKRPAVDSTRNSILYGDLRELFRELRAAKDAVNERRFYMGGNYEKATDAELPYEADKIKEIIEDCIEVLKNASRIIDYGILAEIPPEPVATSDNTPETPVPKSTPAAKARSVDEPDDVQDADYDYPSDEEIVAEYQYMYGPKDTKKFTLTREQYVSLGKPSGWLKRIFNRNDPKASVSQMEEEAYIEACRRLGITP